MATFAERMLDELSGGQLEDAKKSFDLMVPLPILTYLSCITRYFHYTSPTCLLQRFVRQSNNIRN